MGRYAHPRSNRGRNKSAVSQALRILTLSVLVFLCTSTQVFAQRPFDPGKGEVVGNPTDGVATIKGIEAIFENVISIALAFAGITLFVMFLTGGFRYITAGGDAKAVEAAKGTLTHAIAGLVVLILAWIIIQFIEVLTGVRLSIFEIYRQ